MKESTSKDNFTNDKEVHIMPPVELIESERVAYIKEMEDYLLNLKRMSKRDAQRISKENLINSQIIQENGEFAEHYNFNKNKINA